MLARPVASRAHQSSHCIPLLPFPQTASTKLRSRTSSARSFVNCGGHRYTRLATASTKYPTVLPPMSTVTPRRPHTTQPSKGKEPEGKGLNHTHDHNHEHANGHNHDHDHSHSHSHSILPSLTHTHSHGEDGHSHDAEQIVEALKGGVRDRGSRITIIGLLSNVGLTAGKGAAGWYMNSASLLADAGHSLSDLLGDFVTLFCWKLSRRPPSEHYPYGFGKFEVLGTATVSLLLTGGAIGIGMHSWSLLADALSESATTVQAGAIHDILVNVSSVAHQVPMVGLDHAHAHAHTLDPNAAWFAAISIIAKEWLYRVTKKVANEEHSPVLQANALHHRSDAYSSTVALLAILGTWWFPHLPLDPIGGLLVSLLIIKQSWTILMMAFRQLTDASISPKTKTLLLRSLEPLLPSTSKSDTPTSSQVELHTENLLAIRDLRAMRAGAMMFVDLIADVPRSLSVEHAGHLEAAIFRALKKERKEIAEVRVKFNPVESDRLGAA